jgi:hypothetical protein
MAVIGFDSAAGGAAAPRGARPGSIDAQLEGWVTGVPRISVELAECGGRAFASPTPTNHNTGKAMPAVTLIIACRFVLMMFLTGSL